MLFNCINKKEKIENYKLIYKLLFIIGLFIGVFFNNNKIWNLVDYGLVLLGLVNIIVVIKLQSKFKEEINNGYNLNNIKTINLKNTESKAKIDINTDTLSIINSNKNIEIIGTLETNNESHDLYKNPSVDIIFPKEINQVKILSAKALYRNGLKVANCEKIKNEDGNTILHLDFEGEQKKYNSEILNGLEIHIYAELTLDKMTPEKTTKFIMNYTNDNGSKEVYSVDKEINLVIDNSS